jgi:AcrR family transcriptional regulator
MNFEIRDLPREYVVAAQRRRAAAAVAEIAHEFGLSGVTTAAVCRVARMARATYYDRFDSAGGCLRYSFAEAYRQVLGPVTEGDGDGDWLSMIDSKIQALYASVAANPLLAELCLVHSHTAPEEAAGNDFEAAVDAFVELLAAARKKGEQRPIPLLDEYLARAILSLAASRALEGELAGLVAEGRGMTALVAAAYPTLGGKARRP